MKESRVSNVNIYGTVLEHNTKLLVDTGAAISVINDRFYSDVLRRHFVLKENKKIENIRTANGRVVPVSGRVTFPIRIGSSEYTIDAHVVPDLSYKVVLGRDFLAESRAIIDVYGKTVTFANTNQVPFVDKDSNDNNDNGKNDKENEVYHIDTNMPIVDQASRKPSSSPDKLTLSHSPDHFSSSLVGNHHYLPNNQGHVQQSLGYNKRHSYQQRPD